MNVILIGENGEKISNSINISDARKIAADKQMDLILVNEKNNVYKIADKGKRKYEIKQKQKIQRAKRRTNKIKEVQFRPTIDGGDLNIKIRRIEKFLNDGLKTKLVMKFKKSQLSFTEVGVDLMNNVVNHFVEENVAMYDKTPKLDGFNIVVVLTPIKKKS